MIDLRAFDTETFLFRAGEAAPRVVCASTARVVDGQIVGELVPGRAAARDAFIALLNSEAKIAFANAPYDLLCMAAQDPSLLVEIFRALREGRIYDVITAETLNAIYHGYLGQMPDGSKLVNLSTGKEVRRYSLALCVYIALGRRDAKANDFWRTSYALLDDVSVEYWPPRAKLYPVDDAVNTAETALAQIQGLLSGHGWIPALPGGSSTTVCEHCGEELTFGAATPRCAKNGRYEPYKNADNLAFQVEADFGLKAGAAWGLRTDRARVEVLAAEAEKKHANAVERYQKKGWIREDGTESEAAVKRSVALAYGAEAPCTRCNGTGRVQKVEVIECRGLKERGRFRGCLGPACSACSGTRRVSRVTGEVTCKVEDGDGCDGTGFDLSTLPTLPRTDKRGVKTDRDTKTESGDDDLADYGEDEFEKTRSTYVPYLRTGVDAPLAYSPNVLVATGRCSYEGSVLHQMPRKGRERECVRARGAWCGSPVEYVFGSTDYEAGELCTLFQLCYWLFGYSQGRDAINASGKPGILHSDLAAEVLGLPLDEFLKRYKAKDKTAVDFRQMSKPINFGRPGGMGDPKLVYTSRKKNAGFTVCERGPAMEDDKPGYWGVRFCVLTGETKVCGEKKVFEWKRRPCIPVCEACLKVVVGVLSPAYFRRYPEIKDYFKWAQKKIDRHEPAPVAVWDPNENAPKIVRERGGCDFPAFCNNGFQGMLAEIGKHAIIRITRECYLGVKEDGSSSPLAGCRMPLFMHDEPLTELIRMMAHIAGPRVAEIMMESGRTLAPDVVWRAETALAEYLSKSMEPVYDKDGKLILWEPKR